MKSGSTVLGINSGMGFLPTGIGFPGWGSWFLSLEQWNNPGVWTVPQSSMPSFPTQLPTGRRWGSWPGMWTGGGFFHPRLESMALTSGATLVDQESGRMGAWRLQNTQLLPNTGWPLAGEVFLEGEGEREGGFFPLSLSFWNPISWFLTSRLPGERQELRELQALTSLPNWVLPSLTLNAQLPSTGWESKGWIQWLGGVQKPGDRTHGLFLWQNATGGTTNATLRPNAYHPNELNLYVLVRNHNPRVLESRFLSTDCDDFLRNSPHPWNVTKIPTKPTPYHIFSNR